MTAKVERLEAEDDRARMGALDALEPGDLDDPAVRAVVERLAQGDPLRPIRNQARTLLKQYQRGDHQTQSVIEDGVLHTRNARSGSRMGRFLDRLGTGYVVPLALLALAVGALHALPLVWPGWEAALPGDVQLIASTAETMTMTWPRVARYAMGAWLLIAGLGLLLRQHWGRVLMMGYSLLVYGPALVLITVYVAVLDQFDLGTAFWTHRLARHILPAELWAYGLGSLPFLFALLYLDRPHIVATFSGVPKPRRRRLASRGR